MAEATGDPAVSPDGERVAYLAFPSADAAAGGNGATATATIVVVDLAGRPQAKLPVLGFLAVRSLDWTADGHGFYTAGFTSANESTLLYVDLRGRVVPLYHEPGSVPSNVLASAATTNQTARCRRARRRRRRGPTDGGLSEGEPGPQLRRPCDPRSSHASVARDRRADQPRSGNADEGPSRVPC